LVALIESRFGIELPIHRFFRTPRVREQADLLQEILEGETLTADGSMAPEDTTGRVREMSGYVVSWAGTRRCSDSLVVGLNTTGTARPLFWIFQGYEELRALAGAMGPDQPIYGLRSCHRILPEDECDLDSAAPILDRYLWETMDLSASQPMVLGGNCQGALLAFLLGLRLQAADVEPQLLVLMEWSFDRGPYTGPVALLYGSHSYTRDLHRGDTCEGTRLRKNFPDRAVGEIPGKHGEFFSRQENTRGLAARLKRLLEGVEAIYLECHSLGGGVRSRISRVSWRRWFDCISRRSAASSITPSARQSFNKAKNEPSCAGSG